MALPWRPPVVVSLWPRPSVLLRRQRLLLFPRKLRSFKSLFFLSLDTCRQIHYATLFEIYTSISPLRFAALVSSEHYDHRKQPTCLGVASSASQADRSSIFRGGTCCSLRAQSGAAPPPAQLAANDPRHLLQRNGLPPPPAVPPALLHLPPPIRPAAVPQAAAPPIAAPALRTTPSTLSGHPVSPSTRSPTLHPPALPTSAVRYPFGVPRSVGTWLWDPFLGARHGRPDGPSGPPIYE